jgi:hypothetical protein
MKVGKLEKNRNSALFENKFKKKFKLKALKKPDSFFLSTSSFQVKRNSDCSVLE